MKTRPCTNPMPSTDGEYCLGDNAVNEPGSGMKIHYLAQLLYTYKMLLGRYPEVQREVTTKRPTGNKD